MPISDYSTTPLSNTTINGINIAEGCPPSGINNAIRQLMADVATDAVTKTGTQTLTNKTLTSPTVTGLSTNTMAASGNVTIGGTLGVTGAITGNLTGNASGTAANVTGTVAVANGGTGATTLTAHGVVVGNGTGAVAITGAGTASADPTFQAISTYGYGTSVYQTAATSVANSTGVLTTISFDTEYFDDKGWHDNSTNNSRITVTETGRYDLSALISFNTTNNGAFLGAYFVNGVEFERMTFESGSTQFPYSFPMRLAKCNLNAGDYVELKALQFSGSAVNTIPDRTKLEVTRIK
jgi:hypothetical protein